MARNPRPHATFGKWSYKLDSQGELVEIKGVFKPQDRSHAWGTTAFLHHAFISDPEQEQIKPEKYTDAYVVRLRAAEGHHLEKFKEWATSSPEWNLLPGIDEHQNRLYEAEERQSARAHIDNERANALAFQPINQKQFMRETIKLMGWQMNDSGYPDTSGIVHRSLFTVTDNAQLAFQAAHYLKDNDYIDQEKFARLNREIKAQLADPQSEISFRLVIDDRDVSRFEEDFPGAGSNKRTLDKARLKRINEMSEVRQTSI